jgi:hypothetical protein
LRISVRKPVTAVIGTLALTTAAVFGGAVPASAFTESCTPAGGVPGMTISACITVTPQTNAFQNEAHIITTKATTMAILSVTQICNSAGERCSNVKSTLFYSSWFTYPANVDDRSTFRENFNSFGHKYRGCLIWQASGQGGGGCSPARSI